MVFKKCKNPKITYKSLLTLAKYLRHRYVLPENMNFNVAKNQFINIHLCVHFNKNGYVTASHCKKSSLPNTRVLGLYCLNSLDVSGLSHFCGLLPRQPPISFTNFLVVVEYLLKL